MAPPATSKPGRLLIALIVLLLGGVVWAFWPGTDSSVRLGLDLQGGTQVILVPQPVVEGTEITEEQLAQTVEIIRARVDGLGVAEAEVTTQGSGNSAAIVVSVPGLGQDRVVELVQRTALLNFRPVWNVLSPFSIDPADADAAEGARRKVTRRKAMPPSPLTNQRATAELRVRRLSKRPITALSSKPRSTPWIASIRSTWPVAHPITRPNGWVPAINPAHRNTSWSRPSSKV